MAISYEFIASYTAASNQTYITFNSIPSTYTHLYLKGYQRSTRNGGDDGGTQYFYNNSQAADYNKGTLYVYYSNSLSQYNIQNQTNIGVEGITQETSGDNNLFGFFELCIPNYSSGSRYHPSIGFSMNTKTANPGGLYGEHGGYRNVVDTISRIDLMTDSAGYQFVTGSSYYLYGIKST